MTPLNYLILIDAIDIPPALYSRVLIPTEVHRELQQLAASIAVRAWANALPD
jgi:predicted nucleic acid-binding protein